MRRTHPRHTVLCVLLQPRFHLRSHEIAVINSPNPRDQQPWVARADTVHQRPAYGAKVVRHRVSRSNCLALPILHKFILAAQTDSLGFSDDEVRREHRHGELLAIGTVAQKAVDEAVTAGRLGGCMSG